MRDATCDRCGKLWASECVVFVPDGKTLWWRVDARRQTFPYHHQATHARVGWAGDETKRLGRPNGERLCHLCRGVARPEPQTPLARRARESWGDAVAANPALARFAPKSARR